MRRVEAQIVQGSRGNHAVLMVEWPATAAPASFRIRRESVGAPALGPAGWQTASADLPLTDARLESGQLQFTLGPKIVRHIEVSERVFVEFPYEAIQAEAIWPELLMSGRARGAVVVGAGPAGKDTPPASPPEPQPEPATLSVRVVVEPQPARPLDPPSPQRRQLAQAPQKGRLLGIPVAIVAVIAGGLALWLDVTPYRSTTTGPLTFEGAQGGPFSPASHHIEIRRLPLVARIRGLFSSNGPFVEADGPDLAVVAGDASGTIVTIAPPANASSLAPGTHALAISVLHSFTRQSVIVPKVEIVVREPPRQSEPPAPPATITLSQERIIFTGEQGGPFMPDNENLFVEGRGSPGSWALTSPLPDWLSASGLAGSSRPGERSPVAVAPQSRAYALAPGEYQTKLSFRGTDGPEQLVSVTLRIAPKPAPPPPATIALRQREFSFIGPEGGPFTPDVASLVIEGHGSTGRWRLASLLPDWLALSETTGEIRAGSVAVVTIAPRSAAALPAGLYETHLALLGTDGAEQRILARLRIMPRPAPTPPPPAPAAEAAPPQIAIVPPSLASPNRSIWNHNGSTVELAADGSERVIRYVAPRAGLLGQGVRGGDLLFRGRRSGDVYSGTAYVFTKGCGPAGYLVRGSVLADQTQFSVSGVAPRRNTNCEIVGYRDDVLNFNYIRRVN